MSEKEPITFVKLYLDLEFQSINKSFQHKKTDSRESLLVCAF